MGVETRVSFHLNVNDDYFICSPEMLTEIAENVLTLVDYLLPLLKEFTKKGIFIDHDNGYRDIRVVREFKFVKGNRDVESSSGLTKDVYDWRSVPDDKVKYDVFDYRIIQEHPSLQKRMALIACQNYNEVQMMELR